MNGHNDNDNGNIMTLGEKYHSNCVKLKAVKMLNKGIVGNYVFVFYLYVFMFLSVVASLLIFNPLSGGRLDAVCFLLNFLLSIALSLIGYCLFLIPYCYPIRL